MQSTSTSNTSFTNIISGKTFLESSSDTIGLPGPNNTSFNSAPTMFPCYFTCCTQFQGLFIKLDDTGVPTSPCTYPKCFSVGGIPQFPHTHTISLPKVTTKCSAPNCAMCVQERQVKAAIDAAKASVAKKALKKAEKNGRKTLAPPLWRTPTDPPSALRVNAVTAGRGAPLAPPSSTIGGGVFRPDLWAAGVVKHQQQQALLQQQQAPAPHPPSNGVVKKAAGRGKGKAETKAKRGGAAGRGRGGKRATKSEKAKKAADKANGKTKSPTKKAAAKRAKANANTIISTKPTVAKVPLLGKLTQNAGGKMVVPLESDQKKPMTTQARKRAEKDADAPLPWLPGSVLPIRVRGEAADTSLMLSALPSNYDGAAVFVADPNSECPPGHVDVWRCPEKGCSTLAATDRLLAAHIRQVHDDGKWRCPYYPKECGKIYKLAHHVKLHFTGVHQGVKHHVCHWPGCNQDFLNRGGLMQHYNFMHLKRNEDPNSKTGDTTTASTGSTTPQRKRRGTSGAASSPSKRSKAGARSSSPRPKSKVKSAKKMAEDHARLTVSGPVTLNHDLVGINRSRSPSPYSDGDVPQMSQIARVSSHPALEEEDSLFLGGHDTLHFDMSHTTLGAFGSDDTFQVDAPSFLVDDHSSSLLPSSSQPLHLFDIDDPLDQLPTYDSSNTHDDDGLHAFSSVLV
mmetsp:Transcript_21306/g.36347  ORF Transcript_21306/g.36347 Transcript_21306/m.36347 type:complete len:680 (+) Transcript_21306:70-2109(+)